MPSHHRQPAPTPGQGWSIHCLVGSWHRVRQLPIRRHMRGQPSLSIVIPAYNEQERLELTLRAYLNYCRERRRSVEVIVVDDGSSDGTTPLVERLAGEFAELRLIRLAQNQGKGYAVRSGIVNARGCRILFADADGATPIDELERLDAALDGGADLAIGSRALQAAGVQVRSRLHRRLIGRAFHLLVRLTGVAGIADTQCGFKLFRGPVAHALFSRMRTTGFSFDVEVLMMARLCGFRIAEVPVNWTHQPGSRVNLVTDSTRMASDLFRIRLRRLKGQYAAPHLAPWAPAESGRSISFVS
jgi:dolichyl-phosphate beta-glucosyltransferase